MGEAFRPADQDLVRRILALERQVADLERMPTGRNSIGIGFLRPSTKAGAPSDADYTTLPPVGSVVYDTTNSRIYVRHAAGVWKSVVVA